jgi:uncharacterized protein with GYD domain
VTGNGAETLSKNPGRIREVNQEFAKLGATVREQYAVLGPYDFVNIVEASDNGTIARVSVLLGSRGSVEITTLAAIPLDEFSRSLQR